MDWSEELQAFTYQCPCGDLFQITLDELAAGALLGLCMRGIAWQPCCICFTVRRCQTVEARLSVLPSSPLLCCPLLFVIPQ